MKNPVRTHDDFKLCTPVNKTGDNSRVEFNHIFQSLSRLYGRRDWEGV